ncbi:MAG TPA: universal stress protein [Rubrobacteraceae bacterium]|nr:universal stress protein [Rubrobacteraceae bacterium]
MSDLPARILVATDGSADAEMAGRRASAMARALGSELHMVYVVPVTEPYSPYSEGDGERPGTYEDRREARALLAEQVGLVEEAGGKVEKSYIRVGEPDAEVVSLAEEIGANMIVTGSRGLGRLRRPIGSTSSSIAAHAHCPVLVVRRESESGVKR